MPHKNNFLPRYFTVIVSTEKQIVSVMGWFEKNGYARIKGMYNIEVGAAIGIVPPGIVYYDRSEFWQQFHPNITVYSYRAFRERCKCDLLVKIWKYYQKLVPAILMVIVACSYKLWGVWAILIGAFTALFMFVLDYLFEKKTKILMSVK